MGGFIAARQPVIDLLRQRARPYLFSNALAPALVGGAIAGLRLIADGDDLRARLVANASKGARAPSKPARPMKRAIISRRTPSE